MHFLKYQYPLLDEVSDGNGGSGDTPKQFVVLNDSNKIEIKSNEPKVEEVKTDITPVDKPADVSTIETDEQKATRLEQEKQATNSTSGTVLSIVDAEGVSTDYIYDAEGNATKDNVIVYTAAQLKEFENDSPNPDATDLTDIHQSISEVSGIELLDENNKPVVFKEGLEGLAEREVLVKDTFYNKGKQEAISELFQQHPDIYEMYQFKATHGSLENFTKTVDYNNLVLDDNATSQDLKGILYDYYTALGNTKELTERLINMSEKDETLRVDALKGLDELKVIQQNKDSQRAAAVRQQEIDATTQFENTYGVTTNSRGEVINKNIKGSIYDKVVVEGKIGNIMIPKDGLIVIDDNNKKQRITRNQIFSYFHTPIKGNDGQYYSQAQLDESKRISDTDSFLIQGIKNLAGNDLSSLEKVMQNVIRLKDAKKIINISSKATPKTSNKSIDEQLKAGTAHIVFSK